MLVSIITVCLNNQKFIPFAIESVLNQTYADIEYIVIDGGSTDRTIEIVKSYGDKISRFISEPDFGIYDAMNKGIRLARGSIIGLLNSDDIFIDDHVVSTVVEKFRQSSCDVLYGDLYYVNQDDTNKIIRIWKTGEYVPGSFKRGWHPPHPTFYVSKRIYDRYGYFDLEFKLASDFELMLRFLEKYQVNIDAWFRKILNN